MRVTNQRKWNRAKAILCCVSGFISLSFVGGLDHAEGDVHFFPALVFLAITVALAVNIHKTSSITKLTKGEKR